MDRNGPALVMRLRHIVWYGLLLVPLIFFGVFYVFPMLSILDIGLRPGGQLDLSGFAELVTSAYYRDTLIFTTYQAVLSTALTLCLAIPISYIFTRYNFRGKGTLLALSTLPFVLPTIVVASAFLALLGRNGLLNTWLMQTFSLEAPPIQLEQTLAIVLIVHVFYNFPIALRMIVGYWSNQSDRIEEAARILGARGWRLWWHVRLPILRPILVASALLVFIFTFTSFGVVLILGGIRFATIEVQIYYQALNVFNLPLAAALSLLQIAVMLLAMILYTRTQRGVPRDLRAAGNVARKPSGGQRFYVAGAVGLTTVILFVPLGALVLRSLSLRGGDFGIDYYLALFATDHASVLFVPPFEAIRNSVMFALLTVLLAMIVGIPASYLTSGRVQLRQVTKVFDPLFMLPLATSAVTLGFGFIVALDEPPLNLRSSALLIPIAHALIAVPFVIRSVQPALRSIPPSLPEAAMILGADRWKLWRFIELPLISRGLVVGATFAFTVSMGEFGASLFVARPDSPTMPVVIFRLLGQPGATNYGQAMAMSVLLMLVCTVSFLIIDSARTAGVGEF